MEADLLDVKKRKDWPSLERYDGVIVGSGVKMTRWMGEPMAFLRRRRHELKGKKLALFISCMSVLIEPENTQKDLLEKVAEGAGVEAGLMEAFGPVLDAGSGSRMGFLDKKIAQSVMLGLSKEHGMELNMKGRNDFRDWDRIRDFAHRFAESLKKLPVRDSL